MVLYVLSLATLNHKYLLESIRDSASSHSLPGLPRYYCLWLISPEGPGDSCDGPHLVESGEVFNSVATLIEERIMQNIVKKQLFPWNGRLIQFRRTDAEEEMWNIFGFRADICTRQEISGNISFAE